MILYGSSWSGIEGNLMDEEEKHGQDNAVHCGFPFSCPEVHANGYVT